jgi:hypothetical protein
MLGHDQERRFGQFPTSNLCEWDLHFAPFARSAGQRAPMLATRGIKRQGGKVDKPIGVTLQ